MIRLLRGGFWALVMRRMKPGAGMMLDLLASWEVDPGRSLLIGDKATDIQAANVAGFEGFLYSDGNLLDFVEPLISRLRALRAMA